MQYVNAWYWGHGVFEGTFICPCICVFVVLDTYVCANILYSGIVLDTLYEMYYGGYEEFV